MDNKITKKEILYAIAEHFNIPFYVIKDEEITYCNEKAVKLLGCENRNEIVGKKPYNLSPLFQCDNEKSEEKGRKMIEIAREKRFHIFEWMHEKKDGTKFKAKVLLYNKNDVLIAIIMDLENNTEKYVNEKIIEETVNILTKIDLNTGVYNKYYFKYLINETISKAKVNKEEFALFFIDFDKFKEINDTIGHEIGDRIIEKTVERINKFLQNNCTLGRYGGDEFVILAYPLENKREVYNIGKEIIEAFEIPFLIETYKIHLTVSIGVAIYPEHGENTSQLFKNADIAMYYLKDKNIHKSKIKIFNRKMEKKITEKFKIQNFIMNAMKDGEIVLYYQPIFNIRNGQIEGVEALIRWHNNKLGKVSPEKLIAIAEETGLIHELGQYILEQACKDIVNWKNKGLHIVPVAINISVKQLENTKFSEIVKKTITKYRIEEKYIEFEITESVSAGDIHTIQKNIKDMKNTGIKICMDDFGKGYSSLSMLLNLHVDKLKIDKEFIQHIGKERDEKVIMTVTQMANALDLKVVAEGIETKEQVEFLKEIDCQWGQGYLWAKPMMKSDFEKKLIRL
ncbi:EAL domain-containing protein [Crassaminicella thermophila]|uniref:EAL domain-containing protein n=1 Tax=Crassaminicella thermophila TaxID=2599308 RepID=A0A5C0SBR9_CRATE|nr:EAL domain-containing protein [Crassaminicella thermophila]QEK10948.1 EAL domain-containing protein [Crassaminicella thermophila]